MDKDLNKSVDETTTDATSPVEVVQKNKSLKNNKWFWIGLVAFVLLLAGLTYFLVMMIVPKTADSDDSLSKSTRFASSKALVEIASPELRGATVNIASYDGQGGKTAEGLGAYGIASYTTGGRKYSNLPTNSYGSSYKGDSQQASRNYETLVAFFKKNKFKEISSGTDASGPIAWTSANIKYISFATYESVNLVCMIWHADATATLFASHVTSLGCADKESYAKAAERLDEFYAAYTKGESDPADRIVLGDPRSGDSNTKGYRVAVVYQEDPSQLDVQFEGLYLKKPGEKDWTYFMGSQGWLDCTEFNTDDFKKAFSGFNCYDKPTDKVINVGDTFKSPVLKNE